MDLLITEMTTFIFECDFLLLFFYELWCVRPFLVRTNSLTGTSVLVLSVTCSDVSFDFFSGHHQDNMSVCFIPPYTPPLYSKNGVYRGIHYFLIFALKHILWVLVRTASVRRF